MKEITLDTKISELLEIEGMKDILIKINPKFKKLNNPVLRNTLAKVATIKQAAIVGGMEPKDLLNKIRESLGQKPIDIKVEDNNLPQKEITKEPKIIINANELLNENKNPLAVTRKNLKKLKDNEVLMIKSDFKPEPLIDEFTKSGYKVYCKMINSNRFETYIEK